MAGHFHLTEPIALHPHPFIHHPSDSASEYRRSPRPASVRSRGGNSTAVEAAEATDHVSRRQHASTADLEDVHTPYDRRSDPFELSKGLKTEQEISSTGPRKVRKFYSNQNDNIRRLLKHVDDHSREAKAEEEENSFRRRVAIQASLVANILLAGLQLYGAISSGSLSLFTTLADALFDPLCTVMLYVTHAAVNKVNGRKYPSGKTRIENAGNISFCFLMCSVSVVLIVLSVRDLATGNDGVLVTQFHAPSIIAVSIACFIKFCLFCYCWPLRNTYSQVRILWEDHRNDVIINGIGLGTSLLGSFVRWWIDPMGAILLSMLIASLWLHTAYNEFQLLIGVSADPEYLQLITYISMTHSPDIVAIDTVRAYHSGPRYIVEVDIVMHPEESLKETHDVAEDLQKKIESLPDVERAYVHVDYETEHPPEHQHQKVL